MFFFVSTDRELYSSFGTNYYFSFPRSCGQLTETAPSINQWHSIIINNTGNSLQLFIDGILKDELNCNSTVTLNNEQFYIGSKLSSGYFYEGKIDEYKIFNRSLTPEEIIYLSE